MNPLPPAFDGIEFGSTDEALGDEVRQDSLPPEMPLRAALSTHDPVRFQAVLDDLQREACRGALTRDQLCAALLAPSNVGGTALHDAAEPGRRGFLDALLASVASMADQGLLQSRDVRQLLCSLNQFGDPALQTFCDSDGSAIERLGEAVLRLHAKRIFDKDDVGTLLLQCSNGKTLFQRAALANDERPLMAAFRLAERAVLAGALDPDAVIAALAERNTQPLLHRTSWSAHMATPFRLAQQDKMRAVIAGIDALVKTGNVNLVQLRAVMAPFLAETATSGKKGRSPGEAQAALALATVARRRWFESPADSPPQGSPTP